MTHAAPKSLTSRWVENGPNTLRSYGFAVCVAIAFLLLFAQPARQYVRVLPTSLPTSATLLIENLRMQLPAFAGARSIPGQPSRVRPVFQLLVPVEKEGPTTEPIDWTEGGHGRNTNALIPGSGTDTAGASQQPPLASDSAQDPDEPFIVFERDPSFSMNALRGAVRYPELAVRMRIEGRVIIKAYINADGSLREAHVATSDNAILDEAALSGVRQIKYKPAQQNGRSAGCWIYIPVSFELNN